MSTRRSEAFWLGMALAAILAGLLTVLTVVAWRSPFMLFRLPEKTQTTDTR
jgi:cytochrome c-type biogenesis protein CcmE